MSEVRVGPAGRVRGEVRVPGDKSISHRALLLGALARGRSYVGNLSPAADVISTAECLSACGASIRGFGEGRVSLDGAGAGATLRAPADTLDCGNSATTMRLLAGVLAGHDLEAVLDGDASLRRRPMRRVAEPLERMGAVLTTAPGGTAPLRVRGRRRLCGIDYAPPVPSAQLKSAVLLAGLAAEGETTVHEPSPTRDHTERLLRLCGVEVRTEEGRITLSPADLRPFGLRVPGDLSAAAFHLALAAALRGSWVRCPGVTLNPGRTGVLEALRLMGAGVRVAEEEPAGGVEPAGIVEVSAAELRAVRLEGPLVPRCIDELPVLAVLATRAEGVTEIHDAAELRVKESDRIALLVEGLRALGAEAQEHPDGLSVRGPVALRPARLRAHGDHRLAMAWAVAASLTPRGSGDSVISGADTVAVSYPAYFADLASLTA